MLSIVKTVIGLVDKTLGLMPTYDQRKKAEWLEVKQEYLRQINKELPERDADLIMNLKDSVMLFAGELLKEQNK